MFCFIFSTKTLHVTISSDKKWKNTCMIQTRKRISSISGFINYLYCWIYSSYILHKKLNKIFQEPVRPNILFALFYLFSVVFICCTTPCHLLPFIVICYNSLSLVVTLCSTRLSFYKRSWNNCIYSELNSFIRKIEQK